MSLIDVARHVAEHRLNLVAGERALVVADEDADSGFAQAMVTALRDRGVQAAMVVVDRVPAAPHGYLSWEEPEDFLADMLGAVDVAVVYMSTLIVLSQSIRRARDLGTRMLFIPADYDLGRPLVLEEDPVEMRSVGERVCALLASGGHAVVSAEGTNLSLDLPPRAVYDDACVANPGDIDFFPGGMWNVVPLPGSVSGVVCLNASAYPLGRLQSPIYVHFDDSRVTSIEGGWEASAWKRWLTGFRDERVFEFSHLSGGLARSAQVVGHDWEDLITRGSILVSGGENVLYGGKNAARGHFDAIVPNATLEVAGVVVLKDGNYCEA
jgi:hypothetical protein